MNTRTENYRRLEWNVLRQVIPKTNPQLRLSSLFIHVSDHHDATAKCNRFLKLQFQEAVDLVENVNAFSYKLTEPIR